MYHLGEIMKKALKSVFIAMFLLAGVFSLSAVSYADEEPFTGFRETDGDWYYYVDGAVQTENTDLIKGIVNEKNGWWKVEEGKVCFDTGFADNKNGTWYIKDGAIVFNADGFTEINGDHYLLSGGKLNKITDTVKGVVEGENAWWLVESGKVVRDTTVFKRSNGSWIIRDGKIDFSATGFTENAGDWYYCKEGKVQTGINSVAKGTINGQTAWWCIVNGKVVFDNRVATNSNGNWIIINGKIDFGFNGFFENGPFIWYAENGKIQNSRTDIIKGEAKGQLGWWNVVNGRISFANTLAKNASGWWVITDGKVNFGFDGFATNGSGWYYCIGGKLKSDFTGITYGTAYGKTANWYVEKGKVMQVNTVVDQNKKAVCVRNGLVDATYTGYIQNRKDGTWWYVKNGSSFESVSQKITPSLFVIVDCDEQAVYLVKNGKTVFSTPCVTGNVKHHNMTKRGLFSIYSKETERDLKGVDYISHVHYWMPFDGNRGLHDATWKKVFGGTEYLLHGSHGCVNMPFDNAKYIYGQVKVGTKVLVFGGKQSL